MEQKQENLVYAVGLSREEYVQSQKTVVKALRGKHINVQRATTIVLIVMCILAVVAEFRFTGTVAVETVVLMVMMIVAEVWMMLDLPRQTQRSHEAAYDASLFSGHSFDGVLTVDALGLVKRSADETNRLNFAQCAAFIESEDMMIFVAMNGKSIVIPARCLTAEDAEATKAMALEVISPSKQYLLQAVKPTLTERLSIEEPTLQIEDALFGISVEYEAGELRAQFADIAWRGFFEKFPAKMLVAVFVTMVLHFLMALPPLPLFLSGMLVLLLSDVLSAQMKARRAINTTEGDICRLRVELTEQSLRVMGRGKQARRIKVPWERITRAVERPKVVEFFVDKNRVVVIPKRCIKEMEQLREIVDSHMKKQA